MLRADVDKAGVNVTFLVERVAAPLRQQVTDSIRNAIALGHFKPGQRLRERELCEMAGVSRTLVRESLRQLETEGLIEVHANRGPMVTKLSRKQAEDIYRVRSLLEGLAAELVATEADDTAVAGLAAAFDQLRVAMQSADVLDRLVAKNHFYDVLIKAADNQAVGDTLRMLNSRITLLRSASLSAPGRTEHSLAELGAVIDAIKRRDAPAAREAVTLHVRNAAIAALGRLEEPAPDAS